MKSKHESLCIVSIRSLSSSNLTDFLDQFIRDFMKSKPESHCIVSIRSLLKLNKGFKIPFRKLKS